MTHPMVKKRYGWHPMDSNLSPKPYSVTSILRVFLNSEEPDSSVGALLKVEDWSYGTDPTPYLHGEERFHRMTDKTLGIPCLLGMFTFCSFCPGSAPPLTMSRPKACRWDVNWSQMSHCVPCLAWPIARGIHACHI